VLTAVNFDDEASIVANEVENVSPKRRLTAKAQSAETVRPQSIPELALGPRHLPAK
jgi:hypothetical protein